MSFSMDPIPAESMHKEKQSCYRWSLVYFMLALAFFGLDLYLTVSHNGGLALISLVCMFVSIRKSNANFEEYQKYQELADE